MGNAPLDIPILHTCSTASKVCSLLAADPFDPHTVTLDNPRYRWFGLSLMKGKLDWLLLRRLRVTTQATGNHGYELSDHKWLAAEVAFN
jgi:hypothetical protein